MADKNIATLADVEAVDRRLREIVEKLNEANKKAREYVDEQDAKQNERLQDVEKRLTDLINTKVTNYDGLVRQVVQTEFAKIGKSK